MVLTVRPAEKWFESCASSIFELQRVRNGTWLLKYISPYRERIEGLDATCLVPAFGGLENTINKEHCIKVYNAHIEEVRRVVPADQLLVFDVKEGWEPLCKFLGKPVPEVPFPNVNDSSEFRRRIEKVTENDRILVGLTILGVAALAFGVKTFLTK